MSKSYMTIGVAFEGLQIWSSNGGHLSFPPSFHFYYLAKRPAPCETWESSIRRRWGLGIPFEVY